MASSKVFQKKLKIFKSPNFSFFRFSKLFVQFLTRNNIYAIARYMLSPVRPSVCLSVRHTGGSVKDG